MTRLLARVRERGGDVDIVAPVVGLVAVLTYSLHGLQGVLTRDIAIYAYAGQQLLEGDPPYVGVVNRAGPLGHMMPAVGAALARGFGTDDLLGMRLLYMLFAAATVVVVYCVGRDGFASRLAGLVSAGAMLSFEGFIELAAYGPREKTVMVFFMTCALWAVIRRRWLLAGLFVSLSTLTLQTAFLPAMAAVVAGLALCPRATWMVALARVVAGGALPVLVLTVYFLAEGAVRDFLDGFLLLNASNTPPNPVFDRLPEVWDSLEAYGASLGVLLVGVLSLIGLAARAVLHRRREPEERPVALLAGTAGAVTGLLWCLFDYDSWMDLFTVLPYAAVGAGALVVAVAAHVPRGPALAIAGSSVATTLLVALTFSVGDRDDELLGQRSSTRAVLGALPDDARLLSLEAPQPLVLSGLTNPIRHQMFSTGLTDHIADTWPGGFDAFLGYLEQQQFEVVSIGDRLAHRAVPGQGEHWWRWLREDYARVGASHRFTWLVHRSLGKKAIAAARRAEQLAG